ncbi:protein GUCD1 isoform X2 [Nymphalis io]|uniref:protein GUCD1 isoform X2 n=1 Tax=Inachis io TaxID=171585 RepID=UPI002168BE73|nr:protein GUCD1 isoform X2 [Nymphalis io]
MAATNKGLTLIPHSIPHIQQRYKWDCGVTCVLMVLSEGDRNDFITNFFKICEEEGFGQTTCTIDLCYLLKRYNIKHCMFTTSHLPNKRILRTFSGTVNKAALRIRKRFENASIDGIKIVDSVLSTRDILHHVTSKGPAIVLVDAALLSCDLCKHNKLTSEFRRILGGMYRGHYIVVVGWSSGKLLYLDPARSSPLCATVPARLQNSRLAPGTDRDIILIYCDYR